MPRKNCLGMIWSVSRLGVGSAAAMPATRVLSDMCGSQCADVGDVSGDCGGGGHGRTHQMRDAAASLPSFEVSVGGGGAAFARLQEVVIHGQAHGAARLAPFKTAGDQYLRDAFAFGLPAHGAGT